MKHELPALPYATDALAPKISKQTVEVHWFKHAQTYINNVNNLIPGTPFENASLEEIIMKADGPIFNNGSQSWNHIFYFNQFSPNPKSKPEGKLAKAINKQFGSFEAFKEQFSKASIGLFGSGWGWLAKKADGSLEIVPESNAGNPMRKGLTPIMTCDVWEHSYYLDYQNRRADYLAIFWDVLDWNIIEKRF
ncbi:MAG: superoxide dismutase [Microbacter sp.]